MSDGYSILIEAARGALEFFRLENALLNAKPHQDEMAEARRSSRCEGKAWFRSAAQAHAVSRRRQSTARNRRQMQNQRPYRCPDCGRYHIGTMP